jgi:hypothetical protein
VLEERRADNIRPIQCRRALQDRLATIASGDFSETEETLTAQLALLKCMTTGLRHAIKNYTTTKSHIVKAKDKLGKSMAKASKRGQSGASKEKAKRAKKSQYVLAESDPTVLHDLESFKVGDLDDE